MDACYIIILQKQYKVILFSIFIYVGVQLAGLFYSFDWDFMNEDITYHTIIYHGKGVM